MIHTGDFKLDVSPIDGEMMDVTRLGEYGREGVLLLMCESTNVERPGYTPSERKVGGQLDQIYMQNGDKRIIIATFSSNVHRVQQIINTSAKYGRHVAVTGRSMVNVVGAAVRLGYMDVPEDVLIDISDIGRYKPEQITIITTGSQGEPMSALYRMAFSDHNQVELTSGDLVVLSSHAIPGNEVLVGKIINEMYRRGVNVYHEEEEVHVSGHACREEIKMMHSLTKPKFFMPIHGEYRHRMAQKGLAESMGIPKENILLMSSGDVVEVSQDQCKVVDHVQAGAILVDGLGVGDVGNIVLRDRQNLAQNGIIIVVLTLEKFSNQLLAGPDLVSRGFVYVRESEDLMEEARQVVQDAVQDCLERHVNDWGKIKNIIRDSLSDFLWKKMKRNPMILPIIMEV